MGEIKYGQIRGTEVGFPLNMGASETFYSKSGRFVTNDASGRGELAGAASTALQGFVREGQPDNGAGSGGFTTSTTEGADIFHCITDLTAVFRLPLAYDNSTYDRNYSTALNGELCDLVVVNGVQYVNLSTSLRDIIRIVGGKASTVAGGVAFAAGMTAAVTGLCLGDGYVDVQMVSGTLYGLGVE